MVDGPLRRLFWRVVDALDYLVTLARLRILDMLAGPEPETPADQQRQRDRKRIERRSPRLTCEEPGPPDLPPYRSLSGASLNRPPERTALNAPRRTGAARGGR
jgi:hypothetical protein